MGNGGPTALERLIDVEDEARAVAAEAVVEAHVHTFLKLPAIAYAGVGQDATEAQAAIIGEYLGGAQPHHQAVAVPDVLAQLHLSVDNVLVAVASLVVAAHAIAGPHIGEHGPRHAAHRLPRVELAGKDGATPGAAVGGHLQFARPVGVVVAQERGVGGEVGLHKPATGGVEHEVACVERIAHAHRHVAHRERAATQQRGRMVLELVGVHILVTGYGSEVTVAVERQQESRHHLKLGATVFALVVVVVALGIAEAPEVRREGVDIQAVVEPIVLARQERVAAKADHEEPLGGDIAVERGVGELERAVGTVGGIEGRRHQAQAHTGVGGVMGTANDAKIDLLVGFGLVRLGKILQHTGHQAALGLQRQGVEGDRSDRWRGGRWGGDGWPGLLPVARKRLLRPQRCMGGQQ